MHFEAIFRNSPNPYLLLTPALVITDANEAYLRTTGRSLPELVGRGIFEAFPAAPGEDDRNVRELRESFNRVLSDKRAHTLALIRYAIPKQTSQGVVFEDRYWSATNSPVFDASGDIAAIVQHTVDVTELHRLRMMERSQNTAGSEVAPLSIERGIVNRADQVAQENLLLGAERNHLRRLFQQAPGFMAFLRGPEHVFEIANAAYYQLIGRRDIIGKGVLEALPEVADQGYGALLDRVFSTGEPYIGRGVRVLLQRAPDRPADEVYIDFIYQPMIGPDGRVMGIFVQGNDITAQHQAQAELQEYHERLEDLVRERTEALERSEAERRAAEAALLHTQKLEAIGKLTGGVAHDFNNVLQVIGGNLELLRPDVATDQAPQRRLRAALGAVDKGARLASQLLAFARRQPLEPKVINAGRLISRMDDMLRRVLGETIALETVVGGGLWLTLVDPQQLENAILNLAINARDAMRHEGRLTIEANNAMLDEHYATVNTEVAPGQYVMIVVTDTGEGMSEDVQRQAFEPFFTTKPEGQGTGLGLSMVYGFVKQSSGHVKIYSEVGHGTSVKIYLPRSYSAETSISDEPPGPVVGGEETVLVVEDDPEVRATTVQTLTALGYRVLKASDGQSALAIVQSGAHIDLLFSDVVMPGPVKSTELARRAKAMLPRLEVLYTSGYTENAIVHGGRLDPGVNLLSKPYRRDDLARKLRQVIRGNAPSAAHQVVGSPSYSSSSPGSEQAPNSDPEISPASPSSPDSKQYMDLSPDTTSTPAFPGSLSILYVEDHEDTRLAIGECLEAIGHRVLPTGSAEQALELAAGQPFDVLFTDITLPGLSGLQLAERFAADYPRTRVVLASGYGRDARVAALGPDVQLLQKPYDIAAMEVALERAAQALRERDASSAS